MFWNNKSKFLKKRQQDIDNDLAEMEIGGRLGIFKNEHEFIKAVILERVELKRKLDWKNGLIILLLFLIFYYIGTHYFGWDWSNG